MYQEFLPESAPGYAKHSSTFKNDDRCYEVAYFVGDDEREVATRTAEHFLDSKDHIDYDVNYSLEGDCWVGVVARDH